MSTALFELTAYELTSLVRAKDAVTMGTRIAAIAAEQGVGVKQVLDAIWASGTITGQAAGSAAVRAGAQSLARGAWLRIQQLGTRVVVRHATRQLGMHAMGVAIGTAGAGAAVATGGGAATTTGLASSATAGGAGAIGLCSILGGLILIGLVIGAGYYFTRSGEAEAGSTVERTLPPVPVIGDGTSTGGGYLDHGEIVGLGGTLEQTPPSFIRGWSLASRPRVVVAKDGSSTTGSYIHRGTYTSTPTSARYDKKVFKKASHAGTATDRLDAHYSTEARWSALPGRIDGAFRMQVSARADKHVGHQIAGRHIRIRADGATVRRLHQSKPHRSWDAIAGRYLAESKATLEITPKTGYEGRIIIRIHTDGYKAEYTYLPR